jgi:hypothetical protein
MIKINRPTADVSGKDWDEIIYKVSKT